MYWQIRALNRVLCVGETLRHALNCLAIVSHRLANTASRVGSNVMIRMEDARTPLGEGAALPLRKRLGMMVLACSSIYETLDFLRAMPAVETLRQVWVQNYEDRG